MARERVGNTPDEAPGLRSLIKNPPPSAQRYSRPPAPMSMPGHSDSQEDELPLALGAPSGMEDRHRTRLFPWETDLSASGDDLSADTSQGGFSTLSESVVLQQAVAKLNSVAASF